MGVSISVPDLSELSVDERIELAQTIWDSIAAEPEKLELTTAQRQELERRSVAYETNPQAVIPWEQVKAQALARRNAHQTG